MQKRTTRINPGISGTDNELIAKFNLDKLNASKNRSLRTVIFTNPGSLLFVITRSLTSFYYEHYRVTYTIVLDITTVDQQ